MGIGRSMAKDFRRYYFSIKKDLPPPVSFAKRHIMIK
jgi:hypothetical protein